jgi:hypothetical protein
MAKKKNKKNQNNNNNNNPRRNAPRARRNPRSRNRRALASGLSLAAKNYLGTLLDPQRHLSCVIDEYGAYSRCYRSRAVSFFACGTSSLGEQFGGLFIRPSCENGVTNMYALSNGWVQTNAGTWTSGDGIPFSFTSELPSTYFINGGGTGRARIVGFHAEISVTSPPQATSGTIVIVRHPTNRNLSQLPFTTILSSEQVRTYVANELIYKKAHVIYNNVVPNEFDYVGNGNFPGSYCFGILAYGYTAATPPSIHVEMTAVFEVTNESLTGGEASVTDVGGLSAVKNMIPDVSSWCDGDGSPLCDMYESFANGFGNTATTLAGNAGSFMATGAAMGLSVLGARFVNRNQQQRALIQ